MNAVTKLPLATSPAPRPRDEIIAAVKRIGLTLPRQAPIRDFVSQNKLMAFEHLPFEQALEVSEQISGIRGYLPESEYRQLFATGRITEADLQTALDSQADLAEKPRLDDGQTTPISLRELYRISMLFGIEGLTPAEFNRRLHRQDCFRHFQPDVPAAVQQKLLEAYGYSHQDGDAAEPALITDLWQACLETLNLGQIALHPEELTDLSRSQAEDIFNQFAARSDDSCPVAPGVHQAMRAEEKNHLGQFLAEIGTRQTFRTALIKLTGRDLLEDVRPLLIRIVAAQLDEGIAPWPRSKRRQGLYASWRADAGLSLSLGMAILPDWRERLNALPADSTDAVIAGLKHLGVPVARWEGYLHQLAWELPGWAGMVNWRESHPSYHANREAPADLMDFLAIRLFLDQLWIERICVDSWGIHGTLTSLQGYFENNVSEFFVRYNLFSEQLPEYLAASGQSLIRLSWAEKRHKENWRTLADMIWTWQHSPAAPSTQGHSVYRSAWRLFRLAQHLALPGQEIRRLGRVTVEALLETLDRLTPNRKGYLWLLAYEHHYRYRLFNALDRNTQRPRWQREANRPQAQLIFCMDDREESIRRHLEELNPAIETLGAAGFFGVAIRWLGVGDREISNLCPPVVTPAHEIREVPRDDADPGWNRRRRTNGFTAAAKTLFSHTSRRNLLASPILVTALAPVALINLAARILMPLGYQALNRKLAEALAARPPTAMTLAAHDTANRATPDKPRVGFTETEQADKVEGLLRTIGLISDFAPLVVLAGHGATSQNNPHFAAYDCGACSGRHGGPNARVFAAMANNPKVRKLLAQRGIDIPPDTWFIGTNHNTTSEVIDWFDLDEMPSALLPAQHKLETELANAARLSAHERCRRFASAPRVLSPQGALRHVIGRSLALSQARPELGHAGNAAALIGRRSTTRGVFFDRRLFLISYDAAIDPDGRILENILLAAGPVGAGINLEYFFSRVNNPAFGANSKAQHNVTGLFGVMEGTTSDLRTGFPWQMIELHEPMRLQMVVEASTAVLSAIYERQPALRDLIGNEWLLLSAIDPETGAITVFDRQKGFKPWIAAPMDIPQVPRSLDWYAGHDGPLPPAFTGAAHAV